MTFDQKEFLIYYYYYHNSYEFNVNICLYSAIANMAYENCIIIKLGIMQSVIYD